MGLSPNIHNKVVSKDVFQYVALTLMSVEDENLDVY